MSERLIIHCPTGEAHDTVIKTESGIEIDNVSRAVITIDAHTGYAEAVLTICKPDVAVVIKADKIQQVEKP